MSEIYKTVAAVFEAEITEKKSSFIATIAPVATEKDVFVFLAEMQKKYRDATHNVFAYRIQNGIEKYSDNGEPSGSAGFPVMNVLKGEGLNNVVINVTRYFGGTLLGVGGLVRAYGGAAKEVVNISKIIEKKPYNKCFLAIDYTMVGKIQYFIGQNDYILNDTIYTETVNFEICIPEQEIAKAKKSIIEMTGGQNCLEVKELEYLSFFNGTYEKIRS